VRQLAAHRPYIRACSQADRDDGLVVVGVHTPEFSFEHDVDRVRDATIAREIDYPVVLDSDYTIWRAFDNHYRPALYFADRDGVIRDDHFSPGDRTSIPFRVLIDGEAPGEAHGVDVDEHGNGVLDAGRLYQLVRQYDGVGERTLEISFLDDGAEAYVFTFG
jgi:hypothetical protein